MTKYTIEVTENQLNTIGLACEFYGRIQLGQVREVANVMPLQNELIAWQVGDEIEQSLTPYLGKFKHDENGNRVCDVALDMWRNIIRKDNFCMGSEPPIKIEKIE